MYTATFKNRINVNVIEGLFLRVELILLKITWKVIDQNVYNSYLLEGLRVCGNLNDFYFIGDTTVFKSIFLSFCLFWAAPAAYGGSQAGGLIGSVAASLHQSHSKAGSELHL